MITELAKIDIRDGQSARFEAAAAKGIEIVKAARGCHSVTLHRSHEVEHRYWLVAVWEALDDHVNGFQKSDRFEQWRALVAEHFAAIPLVEHLEYVVGNPGRGEPRSG